MKYMSLKNMTEEEKKARKRKQKAEAQKRYYQKNKDYYKNYSKQWAKELLKSKDKEIERLNNIIDELEKILKYDIKKSEQYMDRFIGEEQGNYPVHYYRAEWQKEKAIGYLDKLNELKGDNK